MEVKDIDIIVEKLNQVERTFGFWGVLLFIIVIIALVLTWKYFSKNIESVAEESSEKALKKFQSQLDKDLIKFQTKHQKQVDAIHETFQKFQRLTGIINFIMKGDNFTQQLKPHDDVQYLIQFRHEFKKVYNQNRLLFPEQLCAKIDSLIPNVDNFIETYNKGLFPEPSEEEKELNAEENNGLYLAGIWSQNAFDGLEELEQISKDIETEFRKIYGTHE
jgi:hypothetical protein